MNTKKIIVLSGIFALVCMSNHSAYAQKNSKNSIVPAEVSQINNVITEDEAINILSSIYAVETDTDLLIVKEKFGDLAFEIAKKIFYTKLNDEVYTKEQARIASMVFSARADTYSKGYLDSLDSVVNNEKIKMKTLVKNVNNLEKDISSILNDAKWNQGDSNQKVRSAFKQFDIYKTDSTGLFKIQKSEIDQKNEYLSALSQFSKMARKYTDSYKDIPYISYDFNYNAITGKGVSELNGSITKVRLAHTKMIDSIMNKYKLARYKNLSPRLQKLILSVFKNNLENRIKILEKNSRFSDKNDKAITRRDFYLIESVYGSISKINELDLYERAQMQLIHGDEKKLALSINEIATLNDDVVISIPKSKELISKIDSLIKQKDQLNSNHEYIYNELKRKASTLESPENIRKMLVHYYANDYSEVMADRHHYVDYTDNVIASLKTRRDLLTKIDAYSNDFVGYINGKFIYKEAFKDSEMNNLMKTVKISDKTYKSFFKFIENDVKLFADYR